MNKKYLMFDMDGTLLDSMICAWCASGPEYAYKVLGYDVPELSNAFARLSIKKALYQLADLAEGKEVSLEGFSQVLLEHYLTDVKVKKGVLEFLKLQKDKGSKMCVITATPKSAAIPALKHLGLYDFFDFVITYEDCPEGKSTPKVFNMACDKFGCDISEAAMFEDALYSIKTSTSIGLYTVGVYEDFYKDNQDEIKKLVDLYLANGFEDLL